MSYINDIAVECDGFSQRPVLTVNRARALRVAVDAIGRGIVDPADVLRWLADLEAEATSTAELSVDWDCDFTGTIGEVDASIRGTSPHLHVVWTCPDCGTEHSDGPYDRADLDGSV